MDKRILSIEEFLEELYGGVQKGYLAIWSRSTKRTRWVKVGDWETARKVAGELGADVYFGVGIQREDLGTRYRGAAETVIAIPGCWLDIDVAGGPHRKPNLPGTYEDARNLLSEFPLEPTIIIDSGHGLHTYWLFREPWIIESESDSSEAAGFMRKFQRAFFENAAGHGWTIDATFDLARVLRIPETRNEDKTVTVTDFSPLCRYNPSDFEEYLPERAEPVADVAPKEAPHKDKAARLHLKADANPPLEKWNALVMADPDCGRSFAHQRDDLRDQSMSGYDLSLATRSAIAGWSDQEIADLLIAHRRRFNEDLKLDRPDYYKMTIGRAKAAAEKPREQMGLNIPLEETLHMDNAERRSRILSLLSEALAVPITRITKFATAGGALYRLESGGNALTLGGVSNLIEQHRFRAVMAEIGGKYIKPFKADAWTHIAQNLLDACEEVDVSDDVTEDGSPRVCLQGYIEQCPPTIGDGWGRAALSNMPFEKDGVVYIAITGLRRYMSTFSDERVSAKAIAASLRTMKCEPTVVGVQLPNGSWTTRAVWAIHGARQSD